MYKHYKKVTAALCFIVIMVLIIIDGKHHQLIAQDKKSGQLMLRNIHDTTIAGLTVSGATADCIHLVNCQNIVIKNCTLISSAGSGIFLDKCQHITITNCYMADVATGLYALDSRGIKFNYNQVKNVKGPFPRGQMAQFDNVSGPGNCVNFNKCENISGASYPEDIINMYQTNGTAASPVQVIGNQIRGGGPSKTGGGIMLGDKGGSYIIAKDNILVNPGQYGMAIAGGTHMQIINNTVFAGKQAFTNVGIYIWKQSDPACALNIISGNKVNWANARGEPNHSWNNGNCGPVAGWDTNIWGAAVNEKILPKKLLSH